MRGVNNPLDKIEAKIMSQKKNIDYRIDDGSSLFDSPHKNFYRVYNSMTHANTNIQPSTLDQERKKMGDNLKAMGQMSHSDSKESVRKNDIKMGSKNNIQIEEQVEENSNILNKQKEQESPFEITQQAIAQNLGSENLSAEQQRQLQEEVMKEVNQNLQKENQIKALNNKNSAQIQSNSVEQIQSPQFSKIQNDKQEVIGNMQQEDSQQELKDKILSQDIMKKLKKDQDSLQQIKKQQLLQQQSQDVDIIQNENTIFKNKIIQEQVQPDSFQKQNNQSFNRIKLNQNQISESQKSQLNQESPFKQQQNNYTQIEDYQQSKQINSNFKLSSKYNKENKLKYTESQNKDKNLLTQTQKNISKEKILNLNKNQSKIISALPQTECQDCKKNQKNISTQHSQIQLVKLKGREFKIPLAATDDAYQLLLQQNGQQIDSDQNSLTFEIIPKDSRGAVGKEIQVLNSERIIGYNTYSNILDRGVDDDQSLSQTSLGGLSGGRMVDDGDYYNVTLNLIVKKVNFIEQSQKQPSQVEQAQPISSVAKEFNEFSKSNYAAAATLDISNSEAKKEIAESENYQSKIAKQQVQLMDSQIKDEINQANQQKIYQAQQIEDQQLLQVQKSQYDGLNRKVRRADQFDDEDGSSHNDDYFQRQKQIQKQLQRIKSKQIDQQLKKLDLMSVQELKERKQKILQERKARRDHLKFMQKLRQKGMASGSPTEEQELRELEEQERLQKIEVDQILEPSFNEDPVQNIKVQYKKNEHQQQAIKYNENKIAETVDENNVDPNCEENQYQPENHEIKQQIISEPQQVIKQPQHKIKQQKQEVQLIKHKTIQQESKRIRVKEPESYSQEIVNKEDRFQEQITNKFMNEMHKNYDYLSKNYQNQQVIPLIQDSIQNTDKPVQQSTQQPAVTQNISLQIQNNQQLQNNTNIAQKQDDQDEGQKQQQNEDSVSEQQENPIQLQQKKEQEQQKEQVLDNTTNEQKTEEIKEAPTPKILQNGLVESSKQVENKESDEVQEVPIGFTEDEESEDQEDQSFTQVKSNRLHSKDKIIIKKLNKKFNKLTQLLKPSPILQNINNNKQQNERSTSILEQEQKELEERIHEELRLLKQIADKKKQKEQILKNKKKEVIIEQSSQIDNIKQEQQIEEQPINMKQQIENNQNFNQDSNEEDSPIQEQTNNIDNSISIQKKQFKSKIDKLNDEFEQQQIQKQKKRQEQLTKLRLLLNKQKQKLIKQQIQKQEQDSISSQQINEHIQNKQESESPVDIHENRNTQSQNILQNRKINVNQKDQILENEIEKQPIELPKEEVVKVTKVKVLKKPVIQFQQLKDEVDEDEDKRQQELVQKQKREQEMKDTQKELDQIQKDLQEAQKQAEQYEQERIQQLQLSQEYYIKNQQKNVQQKIEEEESKPLNEEKMDLSVTADLESQAVQKIEQARLIGEKKGAEAAAKMIDQQKKQSHEENIKQFNELKKKLQTTSQQVEQIVDNFQRVHSDLKELKNEYIQQKNKQRKTKKNKMVKTSQPSGSVQQVQISESISLGQGVESQNIMSIEQQILNKRNQLKQMMLSFKRIKNDLQQISAEKNILLQIPSKESESSEQQQTLNKMKLQQLEKFRKSLGKTIEQSQKLGEDDLLQIQGISDFSDDLDQSEGNNQNNNSLLKSKIKQQLHTKNTTV